MLSSSKRALFILAIVFSILSGIIAQETPIPDAVIVNDEGGPVLITGSVTYTNTFFTAGVAEPLIILEDQAGFVARDESFLFPPESQTMGQITSDFYTSPFTYSVALPIEPQGTLSDVDNDGIESAGVMVFAVAYWNNTWGDPYLEERDMGGAGWSTAYASTLISSDADNLREVIGGKYLVYSPDRKQGFPSGFGEDGLLFTEDDPIVRLPQGYTVVDMDTDPFTFDRSRRPVIDLLEPESTALVDYGDLNFVDAFDAMVEKFRNEYAFTEYKHLDWDALHEEFLPMFEQAQQQNDSRAYMNAVREFTWSIPDGHVSMSPFNAFIQDFQYSVALGVGIAIHETDDGRALVTYLTPGSPAARAGIKLGTEIIAFDDVPIADVISAQEPWTQPFSSPHNLRLEQARYATRFNADTTAVKVAYRNPGESTEQEVTLPAVGEVDSFNNTNESTLTGFELPVEYEILPSGYGYVTITTFFDNTLLTIQLWERMIQQFKEAGIPGIIIDMRQNGGGSGFLSDQMAGYFFEEALIVGNSGFYDEDRGEFVFDPDLESRMFLPNEELRYDGPVAVLIGPNCASACESFAYNMTLEDRAAIVGQYPTAGLGGSVNEFRMPLGVTIRFTVGRSVDPEGNIHIEGTGVVPTIDVPVNEETLFSDGDPVLEYGLQYLDSQ